jgi:predicted secreted protein
VDITEADDGTTVAVPLGGILRVSLAGNPTTGHWWWVTYYDTSVIEQLGEYEYVPDPAPPGFVGSGGTFIFRFETTGPGSTALELIYANSPEADPAELPAWARFEVTVNVS